MLFHRKEEKYRLSLTDKEYRLLLDCLMIRRNKVLLYIALKRKHEGFFICKGVVPMSSL